MQIERIHSMTERDKQHCTKKEMIVSKTVNHKIPIILEEEEKNQ